MNKTTQASDIDDTNWSFLEKDFIILEKIGEGSYG